ncbi:unnamed protein product [Victoria cruziana]
MAGRKHRTLQELYRAIPKIAKPKVTPVLQGIYHIQGPEDELELTTGASKEAPLVSKISPYEDIHLRAELGIPGACVAPCSSCTGSPCPTASDVEMSGESGERKVVKQVSPDDAEPPILRSSMCDDQPQTSDTSNFVSACSSRDSFSENVDSKGTQRLCDTSSAFLCDGSKLLTSEEQVDDNHTGGCSKSGLHNGLHTVCELVNGGRHDDSSCYAGKMGTHSTSTPDPGHKRNSTCESLGDLQKQATNRETGGKDRCLSNTVSDTTSAQSNVTSHTLTGTASSKCPEEILNSDDNLSHLSEGGELKTLPCDHHVESKISGTGNSKDGVSVEKRTSSSMVSTSVLSKSSDGSDAMDLLCSSTNSSHAELLEVDISRKQEANASLSDCFLNKSLATGHVKTDSNSFPTKEPDMEHSPEKKSMPQLRRLDTVIPATCEELDEISKMDKKEPTVSTLELQGTATETDETKLVTKASLDMLSGSGGPSVNAAPRSSPIFGEANVYPYVETEHGKVPLHASVAVAGPEENGIAFSSLQSVEKPLVAKNPCSADASEKQEPQSESEHTEPDLDETDVKVCDICGDAGREEKLAICSRCNDGAEHIYCMKIMLEKVPEGEWLCEECKSKENESQKSDNSESSLPASKVSCASDKNKFPKSIFIPDCPSKLEPRLPGVEARKTTEHLTPPLISVKRHADSSEPSVSTKKQAIEAVKTPSSSTLARKTLFLREGSFKKLDKNEVKPSHQLPLAGGKSSNQPEEVYLSTPHVPRLQSPRAKCTSHDNDFQFGNSGKMLPYGSSDSASKAALSSKGVEGLSKLFSSQDMKLKPKTKVIQILEEVPKKQSASGDSRKEGSIRTVSNSSSKSMASTRNSNVDNLKSESRNNILSARELKSLKQFKEGSNLIGRQNSLKLDPSMNGSMPTVCSGNSVPKCGIMVAESDAKTRVSTDVSLTPRKDTEKNTAFETSNGKLVSSHHGENMAPENSQPDKRARLVEETPKLNGMAFDTSLQELRNMVTSAGNSDVRKLSSGYETPTGSIRPQIQTPSSVDDTSSMSSAVEHKVVEKNLHQACLVEDGPVSSIMPEKSFPLPLHALQPRESGNLEAKLKEPTTFGRSRNFSANTRKIRCFKCSELGHIAQFCPNKGIDISLSPRTSVSIPSVRDSRELAGKIKWTHTVENVLPHKIGNLENARPSLPTDAENNELPRKGLTLTTGVASDVNLTTSSVSGSCSSLGKVVDVEGLLKRSATSDGKKAEILFKERPFLPSTSPTTSSAIPVHDFTWQGSFEVQRSGKLSDTCDGIQAHLSTCASPKVLQAAKKFPPKVQLEEISRSSSWPVHFQAKCPTEDNIALYFFAKDILSYERNYKKLLQNMLRNDLALKANFDGVELLIFTSNQLPDKSQRWNRLLFLWGVFRERVVGCTDTATGSLRKKVADVESSSQDFSSTMTSVSTLPLHVQVNKDLLPSEKGLGAVKATALETLSSTPRRSDRRNTDIQGNMRTGSYKFNRSVSDSVAPLEAQCPYAGLDVRPPTNTFQTGCQTSTIPSSRSPRSSGEGLDCFRGDDTCPIEVNIDCRSMKVMELPNTQRSEIQDVRNCATSLPAVSNTTEASSGFPKDDNLTTCNQDQKLTEKKDGSKGSAKSAEACDNSQKRNSPVLTESVTAKQELPPIKGETHSLDMQPQSKRQHSHASQKSFLVNEVKDEANEEQEYKRLKTDSGLDIGDHSTCAPSAIYDLNSSCSDYEDTKLDRPFADGQTDRLSRTPERSFFSVDFGRARDCEASSSSARPGCSNSGDGSGPDMPDLELALGAGRRKPKKGLLPLFCHVLDKSSENNSGAKKDCSHATDDDAASHLSLSLAFPAPVKERTQSTLEKLLLDRSHVNTSLLLFGGCSES